MNNERTATRLLTPIELDIDDTLTFIKLDGSITNIKLVEANCSVVSTNVDEPMVEKQRAITVYRFYCKLLIDDVIVQIRREVGTDRSFYEPREVMGLRIWSDGIQKCFDEIVTETHGHCRPTKAARFIFQDLAVDRICPVLLHPWCPLPDGGLQISDCYNGDDCWMGAYFGASAHGGLDINHPAGTPLWTPLHFDDHYFYDSLAKGDSNNRWIGIKKWSDDYEWHLATCHIVRLLVDENIPLEAGTHYAEGAGVWIGDHEHSHFIFKIVDQGKEYWVDPWILFWQMYKDTAAAIAPRKH